MIAANVALAVCIWYATSLLSGDSDVPNSDAVFRLEQISGAPGAPNDWISGSALPIQGLWPNTGLQIESSTRFFPSPISVKIDARLHELNAAFVDSSFPDVFPLQELSGSIQEAVSGPSNVALTESAALKLFSTTDIVGRTFGINGSTVRVAAVVRSRQSTSIPFELIANLRSPGMPEPWRIDYWYGIVGQNFVRVGAGFDAEGAAKRLAEYYKTTAAYNGLPPSLRDSSAKPYFQPRFIALPDLSMEGAGAAPRRRLLWTMMIAACVVSLLAAANFLNQGIIEVNDRQREIGIRKALGADPAQVAVEVAAAGIGAALAAALLAIPCAMLAIPLVASWIGEDGISPNLPVQSLGVYLGVAIVVSIISVAYPAVMASRVRAGAVLQGRGDQEGVLVSGLRYVVSITQTSLAFGLIATSAVLLIQANFAAEADPGYRAENLFVLDVPADLKDSRVRSFLDSLARVPGVSSVGISRDVPGRGRAVGSATLFRTPDAPVSAALESVGPGYFHTYGIEPIAGRPLEAQRDDQPGTESIVINEMAALRLGFTSPMLAVGSYVDRDGKKSEIVGVIKDIRLRGLREPPRPTVFSMRSPYLRAVVVRHDGNPGIGSALHTLWTRAFPNDVPRISPVVDELSAIYRTEANMAKFVVICTVIGLVLAAVGLHALATGAVSRRAKEIQLMKLLGASNAHIFWTIGRQFLILLAVATVVGACGSALATASYLAGFTTRADIGGTPYFVALAMVALTFGASATTQIVLGLRQRPHKLLTG